jgi:hypothetical protein
MKTIKFILAALFLAAGVDVRASDLTLDPQANELGDIVRTVCAAGGSACPQGGAPLSGEDDFTIQILSTGFFNSIADVQLVPSDVGFFFSSFAYQLQETSGPGMIASANGVGVNSQPHNAPLTAIATYHLIVDWTLQSAAAGGTLESAGYTIHVLTSAEPLTSVAPVPEPGSLLLLGLGIATIAARSRWRDA